MSVHTAFLAALEADRSELNQRFKLASSQGPPLDAQAFKDHLLARVAPIVTAMEEQFPERTRLATKELYQVSLELFRAGYWTRESRLPELNRLWQEVLPKLAHLMAREPQRVSGSLSNALINLATHPVRLEQWLSDLARVGSACETVSQLLDVACVLAWQAGMTLLRASSLQLLRRLPRTLAAQAIQWPSATSDAAWMAMLERVTQERWFNPARDATTSSNSALEAVAVNDSTAIREAAIGEAARVGDYRGLSGTLMDLPTVFLHQGQLYVTDQLNSYRIEVDCYGCILQLVQELKPPNAKRASKVEVNIDATGCVAWNDQRTTFGYLADATSQAFDGQTLAVTLPTSFHVYLLARS